MLTDTFKFIWILGESVLVLVGSLVFYYLSKVVVLIYDELTSPLCDLPGPPSKNFIYGNSKEVWLTDSTVIHEKWVKEYGPTIAYKGILGASQLFTTDLKALNHIFVNNYDYQKPGFGTYESKRILGDGILLMEGDVHKRQRRVLNPAFGLQQIRELTEIFVDKSIQLRDIWTEEIEKQDKNDVGRIEVLSWLSRMTLDVIGLAGFNYKFDALLDNPANSELTEAIAIMLKAVTEVTVIPILRALIPALRFLPAASDVQSMKASRTLFRIGSQLLVDSKTSIIKQNNDKKSWMARDIVSLLVRANAMTDLPESQRLSDKEVLAQIPTFVVAGHDTTSVATTWALFALTQRKDAQNKLRAELATVSTDNPTMDELNSLPFLDSVVREALRLHAPVAATMRCAMKDDIIPVNKPYVDKKGHVQHEIRIKKGQTVIIPIIQVNRDKSLWGEDAREFKPERWENLPETVSGIPGVWGNMLTFIGGPKACIGYRFSIVEMKALLFTLIRAFEFDLAVPATDIATKSPVVQKPILLTAESENSNQLPLLVRPVSGN